MDPLPVSPYDNGDASFQIIAVSALEVYPEAKVVPGLMIANTDTKHYASLAARCVHMWTLVCQLAQDLITSDKIGHQRG